MFLIAGLVVGGFAWGMCKLCGVEGPHDPATDIYDNPFQP